MLWPLCGLVEVSPPWAAVRRGASRQCAPTRSVGTSRTQARFGRGFDCSGGYGRPGIRRFPSENPSGRPASRSISLARHRSSNSRCDGSAAKSRSSRGSLSRSNNCSAPLVGRHSISCGRREGMKCLLLAVAWRVLHVQPRADLAIFSAKHGHQDSRRRSAPTACPAQVPRASA